MSTELKFYLGNSEKLSSQSFDAESFWLTPDDGKLYYDNGTTRKLIGSNLDTLTVNTINVAENVVVNSNITSDTITATTGNITNINSETISVGDISISDNSITADTITANTQVNVSKLYSPTATFELEGYGIGTVMETTGTGSVSFPATSITLSTSGITGVTDLRTNTITLNSSTKELAIKNSSNERILSISDKGRFYFHSTGIYIEPEHDAIYVRGVNLEVSKSATIEKLILGESSFCKESEFDETTTEIAENQILFITKEEA